MLLRLLPIALAFLAFSGAARADALGIRHDLVSPDGKTRFESTVFVLDSKADREVAIRHLSDLYAVDLAANPQLERSFELVEIERGRSPSSDEGASAAREAIEKIAGKEPIRRRLLKRETYEALLKRFQALPREDQVVRLALTRGFVNGGIAVWTLAAAHHIPLPAAAGAGLVVGLLSGGFQRYSEEAGRWLLKSVVKQAFPTSKLAKGWAKRGSPYFRWYVLEFGFTEAIELFLRATGNPSNEDYTDTLWSNAGTAAMAVAAQGLWDVAIAKEREGKLAMGFGEALLKNINLRADLMGLGVSVLAVTLTVARVSKMPYVAGAIFVGMTASGAYYLFKVMPKNLKCAALLARKLRSDSSSPEDSAKDIGAIGVEDPTAPLPN
jgi:hypothetical protein